MLHNTASIIFFFKVDDLEDEHDYDRVSFNGASDDEDVYKIPRNVVSWQTAIKFIIQQCICELQDIRFHVQGGGCPGVSHLSPIK